MKLKWLYLIALGLTSFVISVVIGVSASVNALASPHSARKMTCGEFIGLDDAARPKAVYWAEGFNRQGKPNAGVIDFDEEDRFVSMVFEECMKTPRNLFVKKVKAQHRRVIS